MRQFHCDCGQRVYFDNTLCLNCRRRLGFSPSQMAMVSVSEDDAPRRCSNDVRYDLCNWTVPQHDQEAQCDSCRLNQELPDLGDPRRVTLLYTMEKAKRRLLYSLLALQLPVESKQTRPDGLAFRIRADQRIEATDTIQVPENPIVTGHKNGLITVNLMEADPLLRTKMQQAMAERYPTVLGHFRHESGHYFFNRLVLNSAFIDEARALFGDERTDYAGALKHYYTQGADRKWAERHITPYASSHPYEDFAESWANYLHIVDTLETAHYEGVGLAQQRGLNPLSQEQERPDMDALLNAWWPLAHAMNQLNRSLGLDDPYPFSIPGPVQDKLRFIHRVVGANVSAHRATYLASQSAS